MPDNQELIVHEPINTVLFGNRINHSDPETHELFAESLLDIIYGETIKST